MKAKEDAFLETAPKVGDRFPSLTVYNPDGTPFETASANGHYSVWTFGCLTCPPSIWNIAGLEAVERDYGRKGVRFYFIYKSLAHPELVGSYVQPFSLDERRMQSRQASLQFGTRIPWIVDAMDNRLKHALGDRPNSQFVVDPSGNIVSKRAWSNPAAVRADLAKVVGPVETVTREEDLKLAFAPFLKPGAATGVLARISRAEMVPIILKPLRAGGVKPYLAKLRAEADGALIRSGHGKLYLGFHLDPLHGAHWNNLTKPLEIAISASEKVVLEQHTATASQPDALSDADPREFLLNVEKWPADEPLTVNVNYQACVGEECFSIQETYQLQLSRDEEGGGARGAGPGLWTQQEFSRRMLADDRNRDGKLTRSEASGLLVPHFEKLDRNGDQMLDRNEIDVVTEWINHHHQPGTPPL